MVELWNGDIRKLFDECDYDVNRIRKFIQIDNKKKFPYLSGTKICNYWLYVLYQYTNIRFKNIEDLNVAPDTHVVKSTHKLGLISDNLSIWSLKTFDWIENESSFGILVSHQGAFPSIKI